MVFEKIIRTRLPQGKLGSDYIALKVNTYFDTKCTPLILFVKKFEESLKGAHP